MDKTKLPVTDKSFIKPKRIFEDSGTANPISAYYVLLENVSNTKNQDFQTMIDQGRYFSIFAPRQSGKTTFLEGIRNELHRDKTYVIILLSFQDFKKVSKKEFYSLVEMELYSQLVNRLDEVGCDKANIVSRFLEKHHLKNNISFRMLFEKLNEILQFKKIVVLIDEFDGIPQKELEDFLASLRALYLKYKHVSQKALYSVGLIGIRNITKLVVGGVSPFNIADHVELPPFSLKNVRALFAQYTEETNQPFAEDAVKKIHDETAGQPWLVNRLGTILTVNIKPNTVEPIDTDDVDKAIRQLLKEKNTHFDNLYEKAKLYKEKFVEIVFDNVKYKPDDEDQAWLELYGLMKKNENNAVVSNNIYKARYTETFFNEANLPEISFPQEYILPGSRLNIEKILGVFNQYVAQIGARAFYQKNNPYEKAGQFLLTAWLYQFIKDGEGELRYEIPSGLGRMDILLVYKGTRYIIETKVKRYEKLDTVLAEGIEQVSGKYLQSENMGEGYLVIFDVRSGVGSECKPMYYPVGDKKVIVFVIGIGREKR